jgi:hypothetical protein
MVDQPGTNFLVASEAGIDNDNRVDEIDTTLFTNSNQLIARGDGSIAVVDESAVKEVHITDAVSYYGIHKSCN